MLRPDTSVIVATKNNKLAKQKHYNIYISHLSISLCSNGYTVYLMHGYAVMESKTKRIMLSN